MSKYCGYEIKPIETPEGKEFFWTDERNFDHYAEGVYKIPYESEEAAREGIRRYRANILGARMKRKNSMFKVNR